MFKRGQIFNSIKIKDRKRNNFDLSYTSCLTTQMGRLTPIFCKEVVAGDKWRFNNDMLVRFMPLVAPIYQSIDVYTHYFYVPFRLLWDKWEDFVTGGKDGLQTPSKPFFLPKSLNQFSDENVKLFNQLCDYFNFPYTNGKPNNDDKTKIDVMPFKAYQLIWNEFYRDQNLQPESPIFTNVDGELNANQMVQLIYIRNRCWEHDYFTSALPFAQKGLQVNMPTSEVNITPDGFLKFKSDGSSGSLAKNPDGTINTINGELQQYSSGLKAETTSSATINSFRRALAVQKYAELLARGGSRYTEFLRTFFGTSPRDSRLQRPEYLGGGKSPVFVQEVLQQSETSTTPLGTFGGKATSAGSTNIVTKEIQEPGFIIGIMSIMPHTAYYQGIPRQYLKFDKFDYFLPQFEHIGEQEVKNIELFANSADGKDNDVFGYLPRYAEYKYSNDEIHGEFRNSLKYWTAARSFNSRPALNSAFVESQPSNEIFAMPKEDNLLVQIHFNVLAKRKMSVYSNPQI